MSHTLFLGCVSNYSTNESIEAHFSRFGSVTKAIAMKDRGFGFVTFESESGANAALTMPKQILDGQQIDVRTAIGKGKGAGGGSSGGKGGKDSGSSDKIFVGGLPLDCDDDQLREHFSAYGNIVDATVMKYPDSGRSRCFGFIQYDNQASVDRVIGDYACHNMKGKWVEVKRSVPRDKMTPPPQKEKGGGKGEATAGEVGDGKGGGAGEVDTGGGTGQGGGTENILATVPENNGLDVMSILAAAAYVSGYGAYPSLAGYPGLGGYAANPATAYAAFGVAPPGASGGSRSSGGNRSAPY